MCSLTGTDEIKAPGESATRGDGEALIRGKEGAASVQAVASAVSIQFTDFHWQPALFLTSVFALPNVNLLFTATSAADREPTANRPFFDSASNSIRRSWNSYGGRCTSPNRPSIFSRKIDPT